MTLWCQGKVVEIFDRLANRQPYACSLRVVVLDETLHDPLGVLSGLQPVAIDYDLC